MLRDPLPARLLVLAVALLGASPLLGCPSASSEATPTAVDAPALPVDASAPVDDAAPPPDAAVEEDAGAQAGPGDAGPAVAAGPIVTLAGAGPPRQTLRLRWMESLNRHWAGRRGADNTSHSGEVTLAQWGDGRARVVDDGRKVKSVLDGDVHSKETTTWKTTWVGTWKQATRQLELELRKQDGACARSEALRQGATSFTPTITACAPLPEVLVLRCDDAPVAVEGSPMPAPAWTCDVVGVGAGAGARETASPLPWVFGKARCLERTGGCPSCGPIRHRPCAP